MVPEIWCDTPTFPTLLPKNKELACLYRKVITTAIYLYLFFYHPYIATEVSANVLLAKVDSLNIGPAAAGPADRFRRPWKTRKEHIPHVSDARIHAADQSSLFISVTLQERVSQVWPKMYFRQAMISGNFPNKI